MTRMRRLLIRPVAGAAALVLAFALLASRPAPEEVSPPTDHAALIRAWDAEALERGRIIYRDNCAACHGAEGFEPANPLAPAFAVDSLKNGHDPYALWRTLTDGYGTMPAQTWLTPEQRYDVVHYVREAFFRPHNERLYTPVTEAYLAALPTEDAADEATVQRRRLAAYGPALTYELPGTRSALLLPLSERISLAYDLHTMRIPEVWTRGFVDLDGSHHVEYKGRDRAQRAGEPLGLGPLRWGWRGRFEDPRTGTARFGPMPTDAVRFRGHYLHGNRTVLSYTVEGRDVLDLPAPASGDGTLAVTHALRIGPGPRALVLSPGRPAGPVRLSPSGDAWGGEPVPADGQVLLAPGDGSMKRAFAVRGDTAGLTWSREADGRLLLHVPAAADARLLALYRGAGREADALVRQATVQEPLDPARFTGGGPERWADPIPTAGTLGDAEAAYALDRITIPTDNPWHSWMRLTDLDFFADGRAAVSTLNGDVWIVSGLDEALDGVRWQRYATGLYEPLGLAIRDGDVFVLGRDRITRLHDPNADGEADVYESFYAFEHVSSGYHAFTFGLAVGPDGAFYTLKSGRKTDYDLPGALLRIAPDGSGSEVVATGFRHPNGLTVGPDGQAFVSDNQGSWIPASKVSAIEPGGYYGYVSDSLAAPATFDPPMFWLPQEADNSSGGQAWAHDPRWGPLAGTMVHTSYGAGRAFYVMPQTVDGMQQAAVVPFPWTFPSGVMRARVNPADGQVYLVGLKGWDTSVQEDASFNRIRYTGRPAYLLEEAAVAAEGLRLRFSQPLDPVIATDADRYEVRRWNYKWSERYGSPHYHPADPSRSTEGEEVVAPNAVHLSGDGHTVTLHLPDHRPVDQLTVTFALEAADGTPIEQTVYATVHRVPGDVKRDP